MGGSKHIDYDLTTLVGGGVREDVYILTHKKGWTKQKDYDLTTIEVGGFDRNDYALTTIRGGGGV